MESSLIQKTGFTQIPSPCFIVSEASLEKNARILAGISRRTGCKILLALKAYALWKTFPLLKKYLQGVCASGLFEARLGREKFGKEVHTFSPAFTEEEFPRILKYSDTVIFNSLTQYKRFKNMRSGRTERVRFGLRVNPEKSVAGKKFGLYDPCISGSRLGVRISELRGADLSGISGLHFHALCEQNADELKKVLSAFERKFSPFIKRMEWVNFGGGHHITRKDYDTDALCGLIADFKKRHTNIKDVYLEPGEAVALNAGIFIAEVLDIIPGTIKKAIINSSAEAHFPDILLTRHEGEPYVPEIMNAGKSGTERLRHEYLIGGISCAAGDVFGRYFFARPLKTGTRLVFLDAAHYSMVKTNTFNGVPLPVLMLLGRDGKLRIIRKFGYNDFKSRLA